MVGSRIERAFLPGDERLAAARDSISSALGREISPSECADSLAQAIVCALPVAWQFPKQFTAALPWLREQASAWQEVVYHELGGERRFLLPDEIQSVERSLERAAPPLASSEEGSFVWRLYEPFLHAHAVDHRRRKGVFYTPRAIVAFIVREIDRLVREEFALPQGLAERAIANGQPSIRILDPAVGTGAFLVEVIDVVRQSFLAANDEGAWDDFVAAQLLPRLWGIEVLPAPCLIAHLHLAVKLAATGFGFHLPGKINIALGDALTEPRAAAGGDRFHTQRPFTVVLGNPPFSSLSNNRGAWITQLVRGTANTPGYQQIADRKLGERKTWLHDDYVKFIRRAQWEIEQAGWGIVGLVTNHGYLDNATFRLMREHLLQTFPRISVVDLHGNRKKGEVAPSGAADENVFGLDQGVAIGLFRRPLQSLERTTDHADLWGSKAAKFAALDQGSLPSSPLVPNIPDFRFVLEAHASGIHAQEYVLGESLADVMPIATTAPVSARDKFVVSIDYEALCRRIEEFRDLAIPDAEIRKRYFRSTRSARYLPGDTRGWKMAEARRSLAAESDWRAFIRRCQYRPLDFRFVFWHPAMIDWPRTAIVRHLLASDDPAAERNIALIARRQMLPTQPCTYFWITDQLALDGIIRSDNLGSESLFPLYLYRAAEKRAANSADQSPRRTANFSPRFIEQLSQRLALNWIPDGSGDLAQSLGPQDVLHYIYALFHAPAYRERYAPYLRRDFPRVLLPASSAVFIELATIGARLVELHLLRGEPPAAPTTARKRDAAQGFRVGGYEVCRKYLHTNGRSPDSAEYQRIEAILHATGELMPQIDAILARQLV
jgi:predicted helicase